MKDIAGPIKDLADLNNGPTRPSIDIKVFQTFKSVP